jgi:outer membrane lipopolysaccharide assembly protein LptE/RlpB
VSSRRFKLLLLLLLLQTFRLHQIQNRSSFFRQKDFTANQNNSSFTRPKKPTLKAARIANDPNFHQKPQLILMLQKEETSKRRYSKRE